MLFSGKENVFMCLAVTKFVLRKINLGVWFIQTFLQKMHQIRQKKQNTAKENESNPVEEKMRSRGEGNIERRRGRCDRSTSGAIDDCDRATRPSTSGARPTSALVDRAARSTISPRDLIDRTARSTIASRDLIDRNRRLCHSSAQCDRQTSGAIWALSSLSLSLSDLGSLFSLSLSFSGNDLKWKWGWKIISGSKVKILVNRKSFSGKYHFSWQPNMRVWGKMIS